MATPIGATFPSIPHSQPGRGNHRHQHRQGEAPSKGPAPGGNSCGTSALGCANGLAQPGAAVPHRFKAAIVRFHANAVLLISDSSGRWPRSSQTSADRPTAPSCWPFPTPSSAAQLPPAPASPHSGRHDRPARPGPIAHRPPPDSDTWPTAGTRRGCIRASSGHRCNRRIAPAARPGRWPTGNFGVDQNRGLVINHRLGLGRRRKTDLLAGQGGVQFAQAVQGHGPGHFAARRRGKLPLGEREVAIQRRQRGHVFCLVLQYGRRVRGDDAGQVQDGLRPRPARQEVLGLLHRSQSGGQRAGVGVGLLLGIEALGNQPKRPQELRPRGEIGASPGQVESVMGLLIGLSRDPLQSAPIVPRAVPLPLTEWLPEPSPTAASTFGKRAIEGQAAGGAVAVAGICDGSSIWGRRFNGGAGLTSSGPCSTRVTPPPSRSFGVAQAACTAKPISTAASKQL